MGKRIHLIIKNSTANIEDNQNTQLLLNTEDPQATQKKIITENLQNHNYYLLVSNLCSIVSFLLLQKHNFFPLIQPMHFNLE